MRYFAHLLTFLPNQGAVRKFSGLQKKKKEKTALAQWDNYYILRQVVYVQPFVLALLAMYFTNPLYPQLNVFLLQNRMFTSKVYLVRFFKGLSASLMLGESHFPNATKQLLILDGVNLWTLLMKTFYASLPESDQALEIFKAEIQIHPKLSESKFPWARSKV